MTRDERIESLMGRILNVGNVYQVEEYMLENAYRCASQIVDFVDARTKPLAGLATSAGKGDGT